MSSQRPSTSTTSIADPPSEDAGIPLDQVFDVLSNERRRHVLRFLLEESESTTLGQLAEHIASIENDKPVNAITSAERKRVYICLYQSHLPKMDEVGVIDFDADRKTVDVGENVEEVTRFPLREPGAGGAERSGSWTTALTDLLHAVGSRLR